MLTDANEKYKALEAFAEHVIHGRWADVRPPTPKELKATSVLRLPISEASAKIRTGPPVDDDKDYAMDVWGCDTDSVGGRQTSLRPETSSLDKVAKICADISKRLRMYPRSRHIIGLYEFF